MSTRSARASRIATIAGLLLLAAAMQPVDAVRADPEGAREPAGSGFGPTIVRSDVAHVSSPPLRVLAKQAPRGGPGGGFQPARGRGGGVVDGIGGQTVGTAGDGRDPVVQRGLGGGSQMPAPIENFPGLANTDNDDLGQGRPIPPDTVGDAGPEHYVQMVNLVMAVFDKDTGALEVGPLPTNAFWTELGGICATTNQGDPIVLYDPLADRWVISQFAFEVVDEQPEGPYFECIAVTETDDPTGSWHQYAFRMPDPSLLNDYPKLGVWPDAFYMGINEFDEDTGFGFARATLVAFERDRMLEGLSATMLYKPIGGGFFTPMPADLDGFRPPPPGTPGIFVEVEGEEFGYPNDRLHLFEMDVDWAANTAVVTGPAVRKVPTANINQCGGSRDCIPQPGVATTRYLDAIDERLMFRAAYRNRAGQQSIVVNHTVDVLSGPSRRAGIRWYEIRNPAVTAKIFQAASYAPAGPQRWMGSIARDQDGNIALGYSVSSLSTFPGIRYAGRLAGDPLNTLPRTERTLRAGGGSQTHTASRWGDYTAMSVDPEDDCTFWYTNEYYETTSQRGWKTRIGSFRFPTCTDGPAGTTISIGDSWNVEGSSITFPVTLTNPSVAPVSVTVTAEEDGGTASEGSDFTGNSFLVSFAPGDTVQSVTVDTAVDADADEGDETFAVNLPDATGAMILDGEGVGTIHGPRKCPGRHGEVANHILGTPGADTLTGTNGRDIICGLGGPDTLKGLGGFDEILGGPGADTVRGGDAHDFLLGGDGPDVMVGGRGPDFLLGGNGIDRLEGGADPDDLVGERDADRLLGGPGNDRLEGKRGNDDLLGQKGNDDLFGKKGNDDLFGHKGNDVLNGGPGTDRCVQGPGFGPRTACEFP